MLESINMQTIYIMCGLPFSGKTTLSKRIASYTNALRISFDELWVELEQHGTSFPGEGVEGWQYVCKKAEERIEELLQEGKSIVYDNLRTSYKFFLLNV